MTDIDAIIEVARLPAGTLTPAAVAVFERMLREAYNDLCAGERSGCWVDAAVNDAGRVHGARHHRAKLSDADVDLIHELRASGLSYRQIAAKFDDIGLSKEAVGKIVKGQRRAHTVMGHKRAWLPAVVKPAHPDEFEACT